MTNQSQSYAVEADNTELRHSLARLGWASRWCSCSIQALRYGDPHGNPDQGELPPGTPVLELEMMLSTDAGETRDEGFVYDGCSPYTTLLLRHETCGYKPHLRKTLYRQTSLSGAERYKPHLRKTLLR